MYHPVMKVFPPVIFLLFIFRSIFSQEFAVADYRGEPNIKIEVIYEKRIGKGVETLKEAFVIEKEAISILKKMDDKEKIEGLTSDYKKMIKKFVNASELYHEGHLLIYTVFDENCEKFQIEMRKMNHYASGLNKAKYYERKGGRNLARAKSIRQILIEADKPEWLQYKMHELEKLAIRNKGRALQIYQDFPVEYNYGWDDDVTPEELARFFNNPIIKLPPEDIFNRKPKEERQEPEGGEIVFRVQIAAHTVMLTDEYIKTFYTGNDSILEKKEGKWYKYQIGGFDNYKSADRLRINCRVPRAFVVAYQGDEKFTIKEALAILQAVQ